MIYDFIQIDRSCRLPMCTQLYEEIKKSVLDRRTPVGTRLPSIRSAAADLQISRTTVESAYIRLCNEGFLESRPQSGYFVKLPALKPIPAKPVSCEPEILYDFRSGRIDLSAADIPIWKKHVRAALNNQMDIISYGEPQGEESLRNAIAAYAYTARGVLSDAQNIVIGAGTQQLLTLFCSLFQKKAVVALDQPGFKQAERIFTDFGFDLIFIDPSCDRDIGEQLEKSGADIYLDIPSSKPKTTIASVQSQRRCLKDWLHARPGRFIIEDDYNGELRYRARPLPSIQSMDPDRIVYLGSFSNLLLPSVRIAYMILPNILLEKYRERSHYYNQTASKIEQIALAEYIRHGYLEKHLRRLKKLYYEKSRRLYSELKRQLKTARSLSVLETSLAIVLTLDTPLDDAAIYGLPLEYSVRIDSVSNKKVRLSFAGIPSEDIHEAVCRLKKAWEML